MALLLTLATGAWAQTDEPTVHTKAVEVAKLKVGDILADGFSLTSDDDVQIQIITDRWKVGEESTGNLVFSLINITNYGANGAITMDNGLFTATITPVDENGQDGNAWVVMAKSPLTIGGITYDSPIDLTPSADGTVWTLSTMPEYDVELEVTYYTDEEIAEMEAYTEGVELTDNGDGTWTLAATPAFDVELEVEYETELALSETTDNSAALTEWDGYEADVTLTRTLATGSWNTFAAPFNTAIPEGWTVKELTSATFADGTLTLNFANAASIEAGKPYLVKVAANTDLSTAPFTGAIVSKDAQPFTSTDVDFIPTLGATTIEGSDTKAVLFLTAGNKLLNPSALPADMKGFRAYFQLKGETASLARAFSMNFGDGETTGIIAIGTDRAASTDNATYTLDGRRISKATQKGVYIQNGKKVIIRSATQGDACQSKK